MHIVEWLWDSLDTLSRIHFACSCSDFYTQASVLWKHVIIPETMAIKNGTLMPILLCAQNIRTLTIEFPFDIEKEKESENLVLQIMEQYTGENYIDSVDQNQSKNKKQKNGKKKGKKIKFPNLAINPSLLPHLKQLTKIDIKSCDSESYESFVCPFMLQLSNFVTLRQLSVPQLFTIRHNCIEVLDVHHLQIGFDGMNIHFGADLIGITHFKKQLPSLQKVLCDELYLFIGEEIYIDHEKSGKQYWVVMNKWCKDVGLKVLFKNPSLTIMLMPREKKTPPLLHEQWENIKDWLQERVGDFIVCENDLK